MKNADTEYVHITLYRNQLAKIGKIVFITLLFFTILVLTWLALKKFQSISVPFLLGGLLTFLLSPMVTSLERKGYSRTKATLIVFIGILILLGLMFWLLIPLLTHEVQTIQNQFKGHEFEQRIELLIKNFQNQFSFLGKNISSLDLNMKFKAILNSFQSRLVSFAMGLVSAISTIIIIPFIAFFLLKDGPTIKKKIISLIPNRYFEMSLNLLYQVEKPLSGYIRGQMIDSFIIGLLSVIALAFIGVDYYFIIGSLAGLANMIPYFGPIVGAIPAILVSLLQNPSLTPILWIILSFALIQLIDNVLISPLIVAKSAEIHPLIVIVVIFLGEHFLGIIGMLLAVPITAILQVIIREAIWSFKHYRLL